MRQKTGLLVHEIEHLALRPNVAIIEGQYMPAARAATDQRASIMVRDRLQAVAAAREGVAFIPRDAVFEFADAQYVDVAHVEPGAGYEFTRRLLDYLGSRSLDSD